MTIKSKLTKNKYKYTGQDAVLVDIGKWNFRSLNLLRSTFQNQNPELIIFEFPLAGFERKIVPTLLPLFLKLTTDIQIIIHFHQFYEELLNKFWFRLRCLMLLVAGDKVIFFREDQMKQLLVQKIFNINQEVIYIGPTLTASSNDLTLNDAEDEYKISEFTYKNYFMYFGQVRRYKGLPQLISGFIQANLPDCYLIIAGFIKEVDYYNELVNKYGLENNDKIVFLGELSSSNTIKLMQNTFGVFLLFEDGASTYRTSLISALENAPVVITTKGKITSEKLQHKENVYFIEKLNSNSVEKAFLEIFNNNDLREQITYNSNILFHKHFSWKVISKKYISIINKCM